jgi:uncharacterized protein YjbI with pentapeptide repeats
MSEASVKMIRRGMRFQHVKFVLFLVLGFVVLVGCQANLPPGCPLDCSEAKLGWVDLHHANLAEADLSGADLSYSDLTRATLNAAILNYASLNYASLNYADLSYADLSYADLSYADLSGADLSGADLSGAKLRWAIMPTKLSGAEYNKDTIWPRWYDPAEAGAILVE